MSMENEHTMRIPDSGSQDGPPFSSNVISGFWRRTGAFLLDGMLLGLVGLLIGYFFFDTLVELGPWGRLLGFLISITYFGTLNSSIGGGQTLGKKLQKIRVVNQAGETLSVPSSFTRYAIMGIPFFLNNAMIPQAITNQIVLFILTLIIFCVGGTILYLYAFNRQTRQSLHDLAVGSYVIKDVYPGPVSAGPIWKPHFAIAGLWCALVLSFVIFGVPILATKGLFKELLVIHEAVQSTGKVHNVRVSETYHWGSDGTSTSLSVNAIWKSIPKVPKGTPFEIAPAVLSAYPSIFSKDRLFISVSYGYDIGISTFWKSNSANGTPTEWVAVVATRWFDKGDEEQAVAFVMKAIETQIGIPDETNSIIPKSFETYAALFRKYGRDGEAAELEERSRTFLESRPAEQPPQ